MATPTSPRERVELTSNQYVCEQFILSYTKEASKVYFQYQTTKPLVRIIADEQNGPGSIPEEVFLRFGASKVKNLAYKVDLGDGIRYANAICQRALELLFRGIYGNEGEQSERTAFNAYVKTTEGMRKLIKFFLNMNCQMSVVTKLYNNMPEARSVPPRLMYLDRPRETPKKFFEKLIVDGSSRLQCVNCLLYVLMLLDPRPRTALTSLPEKVRDNWKSELRDIVETNNLNGDQFYATIVRQRLSEVTKFSQEFGDAGRNYLMLASLVGPKPSRRMVQDIACLVEPAEDASEKDLLIQFILCAVSARVHYRSEYKKGGRVGTRSQAGIDEETLNTGSDEESEEDSEQEVSNEDSNEAMSIGWDSNKLLNEDDASMTEFFEGGDNLSLLSDKFLDRIDDLSLMGSFSNDSDIDLGDIFGSTGTEKISNMHDLINGHFGSAENCVAVDVRPSHLAAGASLTRREKLV